MSKAKAEELGLTWLAEIGAHGNVAGPDNSLHSQPSNAIKHALGKAGLSVADLDLIEINEAFAAVGIQSMRELGVDPDIVNVNGGAIALGHPIGMSGARLVLTLALELKRRGGGIGAAALCGGGGQGDALIIHVPGTADRTEVVSGAAHHERSRRRPSGANRSGAAGTCRRWSAAPATATPARWPG